MVLDTNEVIVPRALGVSSSTLLRVIVILHNDNSNQNSVGSAAFMQPMIQ